MHLMEIVHNPPQGCYRVHAGYKMQSFENINSDANNSNTDYVTSYSASISSDAFLSCLSLSLSSPHQHEIARDRKAGLIDEVTNYYK